MNRPECESERLIYSLETSSKLQLLFENSAVGETYLFHRIASDCLRITVTCENGNRPQDWTFVSSGYTITYDEATAE